MKQFKFIINGNNYHAEIKSVMDNQITVDVNGVNYDVVIDKEKEKTPTLTVPKVASTTFVSSKKTSKPGEVNLGIVSAPIPGSIVKIICKVGDKVNAGDTVILLEAMKMQNDIHASVSGTIKEIFIKEGDSVLEGTNLLSINE